MSTDDPAPAPADTRPQPPAARKSRHPPEVHARIAGFTKNIGAALAANLNRNVMAQEARDAKTAGAVAGVPTGTPGPGTADQAPTEGGQTDPAVVSVTETVTCPDGTTAAGPGPLPADSPAAT